MFDITSPVRSTLGTLPNPTSTLVTLCGFPSTIARCSFAKTISSACSEVIPTLALFATIAADCSGVIPTLALFATIAFACSTVNDAVVPSNTFLFPCV